jgi:hypothetical protein
LFVSVGVRLFMVSVIVAHRLIHDAQHREPAAATEVAPDQAGGESKEDDVQTSG